VKFTKAESAGLEGKGPWRPVTLGIRPAQESEAMKRYLAGQFVKIERS
jgi:nitrate reductase alpha subunit